MIHDNLDADLKAHRLIFFIMTVMLCAYLSICLIMGKELQQPLEETTRIQIRTAFYIMAILMFPLTNLIRHIQLKLNQTMPLTSTNYRLEAKKRYFLTVIVSAGLIESLGVLGFVLFMLGDNTNNLFILTGLSAMGLFLYRPKLEEYHTIVELLAAKAHE
ncbi:hypothetical protein DOJK_01500 [Patescibacteria group bacterium]|nr:hypothetical protein DOJK_01500 [Patescibacteria group bacterium]